MTTEEFHRDQTKGHELKLPCAQCGSQIYHIVFASADVKVGMLWGHGYKHYQIIQCQGCRGFSFRYLKNMDELDLSRQKFIRRRQESLYPSRLGNRRTLQDLDYLPEAVRRIYEETHAALCNNLPVLAGVGIRALIETICEDKAATGKNLEQRIDSLAGLGFLTAEHTNFLHELRIIGNKAAHEVKPHKEYTLTSAMDIVEHLLRGVYMLPVSARFLPEK